MKEDKLYSLNKIILNETNIFFSILFFSLYYHYYITINIFSIFVLKNKKFKYTSELLQT